MTCITISFKRYCKPFRTFVWVKTWFSRSILIILDQRQYVRIYQIFKRDYPKRSINHVQRLTGTVS
jgi:hypothetical protein